MKGRTKERNKKIKQKNGITLISLVVTIVILIILAAISINFIINGGVIDKTQQSTEIHDLAKEKERLELIKGQIVADKINKGKVTVDSYIAELEKEGIITEDAITDNGDGSKTVITDKGYSATIKPKGDSDIEIQIIASGVKTEIPVKSINLNKTEATIKEGETITLTMTILPENATNQDITWTSDNPEIATVTDTGEVIGKKKGTTMVTAMATDGSSISATCKITVEGTTVADLIGQDLLSSTKTISDEKGNQVVIPQGFKIAQDSASTVEGGIVIQDSVGNQFVWIPVSNINGNGTGKIVKNNGDEVEITLGRYNFSSTGSVTKVQNGSEYASTTSSKVQSGSVTQYKINLYVGSDVCYELSGSRTSNGIEGTSGTNTTANSLKRFIDSVRDNKGYYIARYEASYGSGTTAGVGYSNSYYKPLSIASTSYNKNKMIYESGNVWNYISQPEAAQVARNMYYTNSYVESDLVNSYMWDTAIYYIKTMLSSSYGSYKTGSKSLGNTGALGDQKCHIFDMAGNLGEWTTEYSNYTMLDLGCPCVQRGGSFANTNLYTGARGGKTAVLATHDSGFRVGLWLR